MKPANVATMTRIRSLRKIVDSMRSVPYYNLNGRLGPRDAAPPRSVAGSLRHRSRCNRRSVERAVDVLKSGALGFGAEHPVTDQAEQIPRSKIKKGLAEHHKVGRGRLDDVLPLRPREAPIAVAEPMVRRLSAGGERIRTSGPTRAGHGSPDRLAADGCLNDHCLLLEQRFRAGRLQRFRRAPPGSPARSAHCWPAC